MKRLLSLSIGVVLLVGLYSSVYAGDWDVAGKVLTGIEGMRILTGGKFDIIGAMTGIGHEEGRGVTCKNYPHYERGYRKCPQRIWMSDYVWKKKWVPEHREYDEKFGEVIVEGHYVQYKVQTGGHWEYTDKRRSFRH